MPPPLPPSELGHSLGPRDARVTLGGHLDYVVRDSLIACDKFPNLYDDLRQAFVLARQSFFASAQCPYSKKTYTTIRKQVAPHYRNQSLRFVFHHQVQP